MRIYFLLILTIFHAKTILSQEDLIKFNSKQIEFSRISKIEYAQGENIANVNFIADTNSVQKSNGKFILHSDQGPITLIDTITKDESSNVRYKYIGNFKCIQQYIIERQLYESIEYYLVDKVTGKFTYIWNIPEITQNCKYICSLNLMWGMDPYPGGILILKRDSIAQNFSTFFMIEYDNWISIDGYWVNNNEFNLKIISPIYLDYSFVQRVAKINEAEIRYWKIRINEI